MTDPTKQPKPKRRLLRFSLRTFLIILTIFCVWIGWYVYRVEQQRVTVKFVEENGGGVAYAYEVDINGNFNDDARLYGLTWLHNILGVDCFSSVVAVGLSSRPINELKQLASLKHLKRLILTSTPIDNLNPLAGLTSLEYLDLEGTQVRDLSPLSGMTELIDLDLSDTNVNVLTPLSGLASLEHLDLQGTQVSDLTPLSGLTKLEHLNLHGTQVTNEEVKRLQEALPNCEILH